MTLRSLWWALGQENGPGTKPEAHTPTPGTLAYVVRHRLTCDNYPDDLRTTRSDPVEWYQSTIPSIAVAHVLVDARYMDPNNDVQAAFWPAGVDAPGQVDTFDEFQARARTLRAVYSDEFGDGGPNIDALLDLDLDDLPSIIGDWRAAWLSIFLYNEPFRPPRYDAHRGEMGWDMPLLDTLYDLFETTPLDHPLHVLERWWWHASLAGVVDMRIV